MLRYLVPSWWRVAAHEAGHALVAWQTPVVSSIDKAEVNWEGGGVLYSICYLAGEPGLMYGFWHEAAIKLGGLAGEFIRYGKIDRRGSDADMLGAQTLANVISSRQSAVSPWNGAVADCELDITLLYKETPGEVPGQILNICFRRALFLINSRHEDFLKFRRALMRRKKLESDAIGAILGPRTE